jgi:AcrR family transcriptional regulator
VIDAPHTRGQATRDRILAATIELIAREGWEAVTIRKIAAAADVQLGLVNYHFGSKMNLMSVALESAFEREVVAPMDETFAGEHPDRVIEALVRLTLGSDLPDTARRVFESALGAIAHDPELAARLRPMLARFRALLTDVFDRAISSGRLPHAADAQALAIAFSAMLDGLGMQRMIDPDMPIDRIADAAGRLLSAPGED